MGCSLPDLIRSVKIAHAPALNRSTGPAGSLLSRTARLSSGRIATSTHSPSFDE